MIALKRLVDWWNSRGELADIPFRVGEVEPNDTPYVYLMPVSNTYEPTSRVDASENKRVCKCRTAYKLTVVAKKLADCVALAQRVSDAFDNQKVSADCVFNSHKSDDFGPGVENLFLYQIVMNYEAEFTVLQSV